MSFRTPDPAIIRTWGEAVLFQPASGGEFEVTMVHDDEGPEGPVSPAPLMILFGTMANSGFTAAGAPRPKQGDSVVFDDVDYRIYDVKSDRAGGTRDTEGLWLYLDQVAA